MIRDKVKRNKDIGMRIYCTEYIHALTQEEDNSLNSSFFFWFALKKQRTRTPKKILNIKTSNKKYLKSQRKKRERLKTYIAFSASREVF